MCFRRYDKVSIGLLWEKWKYVVFSLSRSLFLSLIGDILIKILQKFPLRSRLCYIWILCEMLMATETMKKNIWTMKLILYRNVYNICFYKHRCLHCHCLMCFSPNISIWLPWQPKMLNCEKKNALRRVKLKHCRIVQNISFYSSSLRWALCPMGLWFDS